jgi:hypothetical protein
MSNDRSNKHRVLGAGSVVMEQQFRTIRFISLNNSRVPGIEGCIGSDGIYTK